MCEDQAQEVATAPDVNEAAEAPDASKPLTNEVVITIGGAANASGRYIISGPAGTRTKVDFTLETEAGGGTDAPCAVELTGRLEFCITAPVTIGQVDQALGKREEGENLVKGYQQGAGE